MDLLEYYKRDDVLEQLLEASRGREVCFTLPSGGYTSRPGIIQYKNDIVEMIRRGCLSIHGSVEHWSNPMLVRTGMSPDEANALRTGWDMIIDIDSALGIEAAKLAAKRVLEFLGKHGLKPSIKFSGRRGFHIGVPFESFPEVVNGRRTSEQFPDFPRAMAAFLKNKIEEDLKQDLIKLKGGISKLYEGGLVTNPSPYAFVEIEQNWGSRHLFRLPYSINEKAGLVSLPIRDLVSFVPEMARPENVAADVRFLECEGNATTLLLKSLDWWGSRHEEQPEGRKEVEISSVKIPEERFPPCMHNILKGLRDGRKRSLFILINFLRKSGWSMEEIEKRVGEWNEKNLPPLPVVYLRGQLSYASHNKPFLPPNCSKVAAYEFGICTPDQRCRQIKNPASYPQRPKAKAPPPLQQKKRRGRRKDPDSVSLMI